MDKNVIVLRNNSAMERIAFSLCILDLVPPLLGKVVLNQSIDPHFYIVLRVLPCTDGSAYHHSHIGLIALKVSSLGR